MRALSRRPCADDLLRTAEGGTPAAIDKRRRIVRRPSRIAAALALAVGTHVAAAEPSNQRLIYTGLGIAPVDYLAGTALHEGSHALAAELLGASVDELHVFPPGVDPKANVFRFGWTYVHGLHTRADHVWFYLAPKLTDIALLGGFAALAFTGAWPANRYGELALTVGATGLWIDFTKDVVVFSHQDDVVKVFDLACITGWRQLPARLVYAAAATGLAVIVVRGYRRTFDQPQATATPLMLPVVSVPL